MRAMIVSIFFLSLTTLSFAQNLPLDTAVKTGKLSNGFTYYIRHNTEPRQRVVMYLVNKVGSMQEDEDQRGLAHFLEHMSFNGTKHYPKNALVEYLQKAGVKFGADLNAYTGFEETVYHLPLPTDDPSIVQNGLQIMRDWAGLATLDPVEIDKERGVVIEEKRTRTGAQQRIFDQLWPYQTNNSRYAQRLPIGTEQVLKNFTPATITRFYKDWYRPNLQALIVVGDIDVAAIEPQIKKLFGDLRGPATVRARAEYKIKLTGKNQFRVVTDPEVTETSISILIKQPGKLLRTKAEYRYSIITSLFNHALSTRLNEIAQRKDPPYIGARGFMSDFMGGLAAMNVEITPKPGKNKEAFMAVWQELLRMKQFGLTAEELELAGISFLSRMEKAFREKSTAPSQGYVDEYTQHFLKGTAAPGIIAELALAKECISSITLTEINKIVATWIKGTDRDIFIVAPEKEKNNLPTQQLVNTWIALSAVQPITQWQSSTSGKELLPTLPNPGSIVSRKSVDSLGLQQYRLSNGASVWVKPTNFKEDEILFFAISPGGTSLYPDKEYINAMLAANVVAANGVGDFNRMDLAKKLTGKIVKVGPYINESVEGISGSASPKDLETAMQLTHLYFTAPRRDEVLFQNLIEGNKAMLANANDDPQTVLSDTTRLILSNFHYRRRPITSTTLDSVQLDRAMQIYRERFANASDFTFVFTGAIDTAMLLPLVSKYIGSLPATALAETGKDVGVRVPTGSVTKIIRKGKDDVAEVQLYFTGNYNYSPEQNIQLEALGTVLQYRMTERIRELEGGAYSPSAGVTFQKLPYANYKFFVNMTCAPANVDKLVTAVQEEIEKIKQGNVTADDMTKFHAEKLRQYEVSSRTNPFWYNELYTALRNGDDPMMTLRRPSLAKNLTASQVQEAAKKFVHSDQLIKIVLLPE